MLPRLAPGPAGHHTTSLATREACHGTFARASNSLPSVERRSTTRQNDAVLRLAASYNYFGQLVADTLADAGDSREFCPLACA